ncbi:hypothetical protein Tco_1523242 [Tanacetum coccineum]
MNYFESTDTLALSQIPSINVLLHAVVALKSVEIYLTEDGVRKKFLALNYSTCLLEMIADFGVDEARKNDYLLGLEKFCDSTADVPNEEHVPTYSYDPLLSGNDRMKLTELMDMCTKLSERVLDLEHTKTAQAQEITNLKLRVKNLEKKAGLRTHKFKRLYKGRSRIEAIDKDAEVTLVETQRRNGENNDNLMFDTGVFDGNEIVVETEEHVINAAITTKKIPSAKPKEKDVVQELSENVSTATTMVRTATTTVIEAEEQAEFERIQKEKVAQEEASKAAIYEEWDNEQAMMEADHKERKKFFAAQRAEAIRNKPPTKTQRRNQMIQYLKNMAGYSHNKIFLQKRYKRKKVMKRKLKAATGRNNLVGKEQRISQNKNLPKGKDLRMIKMKKSLRNALSLRADGSLKLYHVFSQLLSEFDKEDLVNLWKLVKDKHRDNRPKEDFERVLWGDLRVIFEPDRESKVWRSLQGYKVTVWKLYDSYGVHFVRFKHLHVFMLVEKRYTLTPITITNMLNKKLQADHWNEMCYQLLKLMVKQQRGQ